MKLSLEIFCNLRDESKEKIQKALEEKNWNNYTTFVHALKSTSLSIGGEETSNLANKLEAEVLELYDKLVELLQKINSDIDEEVANIIKQLDIECKKLSLTPFQTMKETQQ